jgi:hypothetical protein
MTPNDRLIICKACPEYINRGLLSKCNACGCFLLAKTKLKTQKCPVGKWLPVTEWTDK